MEADSVDDLTTNKQIAAFLILSRYYALSRFAELLGYRVDTEAFAVEGDRESVFGNIMGLLKKASQEAAAYGYVVEANVISLIGSANETVDQEDASAWQRSVWDTGWIGPVPEAESGFFL